LRYPTLVGALLFASVCTRIDITHATGILTRATQNPLPMDFREYFESAFILAGSATYGIVLGGKTRIQYSSLTTYVDADWAGDMTSRRSTAGLVLFFDGSPVDWKSSKIKGTISCVIPLKQR
jgi:hypothetical protein